jgi:hypothetical protein
MSAPSSHLAAARFRAVKGEHREPALLHFIDKQRVKRHWREHFIPARVARQ